MRYKIRNITFIFLIILFNYTHTRAGSVGTTSMNSLKIGVGTRALGMGGAYTALADDVYSIYWNPAGLAGINRKAFSFTHYRYLESVDYEWLGFVFPFETKTYGGLGVSLGYLSTPKIDRYIETEVFPYFRRTGTYTASDAVFSLAYAKIFEHNNYLIPAGLSLKIMKEEIDNYSALGAAFDFGVQYSVKTDFSTMKYGVSLKNIGYMGKMDEKSDPLPFMFDLGISYRINKYPLIFSMDVKSPDDSKSKFEMGAEYRFSFLALRTGYEFGHDMKDFSLGFGILYEDFLTLDYAYVPYSELGNTHYMSFNYSYGIPERYEEKDFVNVITEREYLFLKGSSVRSSSNESNEFSPEKVVDGNMKTRWASIKKDNQWLIIDFKTQQVFDGIEIHWEAAFTKEYEVMVSNNDKNWKKIYSNKDGKGGIENIEFKKQNTRYLKLNLIKRGTEWGNSIYEIKIRGIKNGKIKRTPHPEGITVTASSIEGPGMEADKVLDGNMETRWGSEHKSPQWLEVDLGRVTRISGLEISWETAYAKEYEILVSKDNKQWTKIYFTKKGDGGLDKIGFRPQTVKYIKINCIKRGTEFGYSIYELKIIYGNKIIASPAKGLIDDFKDFNKWSFVGGKNAEISPVNTGRNAVRLDYRFNKGDWVLMTYSMDKPLDIRNNGIGLEIKTEDAVVNFVLRITDSKGGIYFREEENVNLEDYKSFKLMQDDFVNLLGAEKRPADISKIEIVIRKNKGGYGKLFIRNLKVIK